jgi:hypothetical protein
MNSDWISILFAVVFVLIIVFVHFFRASSKYSAPLSSNLDVLRAKLAVPAPSSPQKNGLLVHMFTIEQAKSLNALNPFAMNANDEFIVDCSAAFRKTCSAWTYLRSDLLPVIFNKPCPDFSQSPPLYGTPVCGMIIDRDLAEELLTTMGMIDGDTDTRICCTTDGSGQLWNKFGCFDGAVNYGLLDNSFQGYQGPGRCNKLCPDNDVNCKIMNSGGGVNAHALGCDGCDKDPVGPGVSGNWGCAKCNGKQPPDNWPETSCPLCEYVNLCSPSETGSIPALPSGPDTWAPYFLDEQNMIAGNYVGNNAEKLQNAFTSNGALVHSWQGVRKMCKFRVSDWDKWMQSMKDYYKSWFTNYMGPNSLRTISSNPQNKSIMLANPVALNYLENEVNMYIHPKNDDEAKTKAQSDILRKAILGFFYVDKTCVDMMSPLENAPTAFTWSPTDTPLPYNNARDRCAGFMCAPDPTKPVTDSECVSSLVDNERNYLNVARDEMLKLTNKFNSTYRSGGAQAGFYRFTGQSNAYFEYSSLSKLVSGQLLDVSDFFDVGVQASESGNTAELRNSKVWPPKKQFGPPR